MNVYIVEQREKLTGTIIEECIVMHVASTEEKAIAWATERERLAELLDNPDPALYAITEENVDDPESFTRFCAFVSREGDVSPESPAYYWRA